MVVCVWENIFSKSHSQSHVVEGFPSMIQYHYQCQKYAILTAADISYIEAFLKIPLESVSEQILLLPKFCQYFDLTVLTGIFWLIFECIPPKCIMFFNDLQVKVLHCLIGIELTS